jgi:hypothetical protein
MLSPFRVARLVAAEEFDRLLNEVLMNTRPVPLAVRVRLSEQGALAPAALGLALKRLTELTWRPEPPAAELAERLLALQSKDGALGTLAVTACAVAGLQSLVTQIQAMPGGRNGTAGGGVNPGGGDAGTDFLPGGLTVRIIHAVERALGWLGQQRTLAESIAFASETSATAAGGVVLRRAAADLDAAIDTAIVLWQLGNIPAAMQTLAIESPVALIDTLGLRHHRATATLIEGLFAEPITRYQSQSRRAA